MDNTDWLLRSCISLSFLFHFILFFIFTLSLTKLQLAKSLKRQTHHPKPRIKATSHPASGNNPKICSCSSCFVYNAQESLEVTNGSVLLSLFFYCYSSFLIFISLSFFSEGLPMRLWVYDLVLNGILFTMIASACLSDLGRERKRASTFSMNSASSFIVGCIWFSRFLLIFCEIFSCGRLKKYWKLGYMEVALG